MVLVGATGTGQAVDALEQQAQQPGAKEPRQQVSHHRETIPEHAQYGFRVFLDVLEDQAVEALVEFTIEVHLHQAQEQRDAGDHCQPESEQPACRHGPGAEQGQQQRNTEIDHQAQVETQTVGECLEEGRGRCVEDHRAVVSQQRDAQQTEHDHHDQGTQQRVGQMRFDGRLQQATRSSLLTQGVRDCHVVLGPIGS
ncbi:hypothetical protein D9M73_155160 [compost metagenome]